MPLGRLTVFLNICELIFLCSYSFHFLNNFFFAYAVTVSNFSELFIYAATVFLPELILHKYSVEGHTLCKESPVGIHNTCSHAMWCFSLHLFFTSAGVASLPTRFRKLLDETVKILAVFPTCFTTSRLRRQLYIVGSVKHERPSLQQMAKWRNLPGVVHCGLHFVLP